MRISSVAALLLLAACHKPAMDDANEGSIPDVADADRIECAQGGAPVTRACTVERVASEDGMLLTVRHPDGAFRRLLLTRDGRGVIAADGAEPVVVTIVSSKMIDVAIGGDRYSLPVTVGAKQPPS